MRSKSVGPALAVLFLVNVLNFYDRQTLAAILEPLRHEFSLSDTQLGGLFTLFTVVFALAGLPLGKLADTHSRRGLLAGGIAVWTALTGMAGLATSYAMLLGTRLGVGIGEAVCTPAATSWIGDLVPAHAAGARDGGLHDGGPGGDHAELGDRRAGGAGARLADGADGGGDPGTGAGAGGAVAQRTGTSECGGWRRRYRGAARGVLVDRGVGGGGEFCALQLLDVPAGVSDAVSRDDGGAGGRVDGDRVGGVGDCGRGGGGAGGRPGEESPVAGGGRVAGGGGSGVRGDSHAGGQRGDRRCGWR